ncbi:MAG: right-handed parallel beta-helix repeat-containing protein [Planctomycetota bacterium]|jgi:hypothetical protein
MDNYKTLISIILLMGLGGPAVYASEVFNVPKDFNTIQEAIDNADDFGRIQIDPGTYEEQLFISGKNIELIGSGFKETIIKSPPVLVPSFVTSAEMKCVIGVFDGGDLAMKSVTLDGGGYGNNNHVFIGVGFLNSSGLLQYCQVKDVTDIPISEAIHGVCVYAFNNDGTDRIVEVKDCILSGYQKSGVVFNGENMVGRLFNCSIMGKGSITTNVQNGIQFAYGAQGTIEECEVHQNIHGSYEKSATGILLYHCKPVDVINCSLITNNQTGVCFYDTGGNFLNNTIIANEDAQGIKEDFTGLSINGLGLHGHPMGFLPFGDGFWMNPAGGSGKIYTSIIVANSNFVADQSGFATGIRVHSLEDHDLQIHFIDSLIMKWKWGMEVWSSDSAYSDVRIYNCRFKQNPVYGVENNSHTPVQAIHNDWGDPSGPEHYALNPNGQGDKVSDGIFFEPWITETESLDADNFLLFAPEGGLVKFFLDAGIENAGRYFILLGSVSGTYPGTPLPGGQVVLPLNWDPFTDAVFNMVNTPFFLNFLGQLGHIGKGQAHLNTGPIPDVYHSFIMYFAYALGNPFDFTSNPIEVLIVP